MTRRSFISVSALTALAAPALTTHLTGAPADTVEGKPANGQKKYPIGLELYSVRGELSRDLPNTLRTVAKFGYEDVEFYSPYFDWKFPYAKQVRTMLDDLGMRCYSTHNGFGSYTPATMGKAIELNQILGSKYIVLASAPRTSGVDGWKRLCEQITRATEEFKTHGLSGGYHNHQAEWAKIDGDQRIMDVIAANTPKEFVLQLDVGTCMEAGQDPVAWIKANPGRIKCVHLKDWAGNKGPEKGYRVLFGEGISPWKDIVTALESVGGVEFYLLEQEGSRYSEFETAQRCLALWKSFRAQLANA